MKKFAVHCILQFKIAPKISTFSNHMLLSKLTCPTRNSRKLLFSDYACEETCKFPPHKSFRTQQRVITRTHVLAWRWISTTNKFSSTACWPKWVAWRPKFHRMCLYTSSRGAIPRDSKSILKTSKAKKRLELTLIHFRHFKFALELLNERREEKKKREKLGELISSEQKKFCVQVTRASRRA